MLAVFVIRFKSTDMWTLRYLPLTVSKVAPWMNKEGEVWLLLKIRDHLLHFPHSDVFSHSLQVFWNSPIWVPVFARMSSHMYLFFAVGGVMSISCQRKMQQNHSQKKRRLTSEWWMIAFQLGCISVAKLQLLQIRSPPGASTLMFVSCCISLCRL